MRWLIPLFFLTSCGSYQLASSVSGSGDARRMDILECKDFARTWANRPEAQARAFAAGFFLPVVGIAVVAQTERTEARGEFARCMRSRGYVVGEVG